MDIVSFSGRINRAQWLLTQLATLVFIIPPLAIDFFPAELRGVVVFLALFSIPILWVNIATGTRRLHDRDKSGGWLMIFFILPSILQKIAEHAIADHARALYLLFILPSTALFIWGLVELGFLRGTTGPNQYGPDPLQQAG